MAIKHNYLATSGLKPLANEIDKGELVPNFSDGTLWTKDVGGTVISVSGFTAIDGGSAVSNYGGTVRPEIDCGGA